MIARARRWLTFLALAGWLAAPSGAASAATYLIDSSPGVATTYPWIDISTTGTPLALANNAQSARINIGFTFPFGGIGVNRIVIGSNGWQYLGTGSPSPFATTNPNTDFPVAPALMTLPYWDDLNPRNVASRIRYRTVGSAPNRVFVVSYLDVPHYCGSGTGCSSNQTTGIRETFQVQYHEATGDIIFWYQSMSTFGGGWTSGPVPAGGLPERGATIGVQMNSTDYTKWSFNTNSIASGMALRFYYTTPYVPPVPFAWYKMDETSWGAVTDSSGNGRDGAVVASATPTGYPHVSPPGSAKAGDPGTCGSASLGATTSAAGVSSGIDMNGVGNTGSISFWYAGKTAWNDGNARMLLDASNDLGSNDAADRQFYLVKTGSGSLYFSLEDSANTKSNATTGNYAYAANTWHHIAVTWNLGQDRVRLYLDGLLVATSTTNVNGTLGDMNTLYIGGWRGGTISGATNYTNNSANGYIDEVRIYNIELTAADVAADRARTHPCGADLHHYAIAVSPSTQVGCLPVAVTVTGHTSTHTSTAPGTTITLSTSSGKGTWSLASGTGILTDTVADDGAATYQFGSGETSATFNLFHPTLASDPQTVNIHVTDGTRAEHASEDPNITMQRAALVLYNVTDTNTTIPIQLAGKRSDTGYNAKLIELRALRQSAPNSAACEGMFPSQTKPVQLGFECMTPATCAGHSVSVSFDGGPLQPVATNDSNGTAGAPAYSTLNLTFDANSYEQLVLYYPDAGRMRLNARTSLTTTPTPTYVTGESDFVVRPFGFGFTNIHKDGTPNPGGTASSGSAFTSAGSPFAATVGAYRWAAAHDTDNDGKPDSGADITGNGLTPNFAYATTLTSSIHTPADGAAGTLDGTTNLSAAHFSGGQATVSDLSWNEVGSLYLEAETVAYLGVGGADIEGRSHTHIGRFHPAYFSLAESNVTAANPGGFSYMSQPGLQIAYTLQAEKLGGGETTNYDNDTLGYSLVATPTLVAENADAGTNLGSRIVTSAPTQWKGGKYKFIAPAARFERAASPDGPYDSLQLGVGTSGGDDVKIQSLDMKATTTGDCSSVPDCDARQIGVTRVRFGRLVFSNAHGSEHLSLKLPFQTQYWTGSAWTTNLLDSSTDIATSLILVKTPAGMPSPTGGTVSGGKGELSFAAPAVKGRVEVCANLGSDADHPIPGCRSGTAAMPWLQGSWDGDGNYDDNPAALATFGVYQGRAPVIYRRERY